MKYLLTLSLIALSLSISAQSLPDRYRTAVFDSVVFAVEDSILFSEGVPQPTPGGGLLEGATGLPLNANDIVTTPEDLYMDIYQPAGDTLQRRPAVVICFGGGFVAGERDFWSIRLLADGLARYGFVTATIDYRLGFNIYDQDLAQRSVYRAIQDSRAAVKFLRANADSLRIDTNEIYIGGHSAGAFMALHNLYLDKESERPISTFEWVQDGTPIPDLGTLDATGIATGVSGKANCAFSLAGALGFLSYIEDSLDARTAMFHSQDDGTVPYDTGEPFSNIPPLFLLGSDLPTVYGSFRIGLKCDSVALRDTLYSYTDRGHGVHELLPDSVLRDDILPGIGNWFHAERLVPDAYPIDGPAVICESELEQVYSVIPGDAVYFDWNIEGGNVVDGCTSCDSIIVSWSDTASSRMISVTPYNAFSARGVTQTLEVNSISNTTNQWTGGSGNWFSPEEWSEGRIPLPCDEVIISSNDTLLNIDIPAGEFVTVKSLSTFGNVQINIAAGATFEVTH